MGGCGGDAPSTFFKNRYPKSTQDLAALRLRQCVNFYAFRHTGQNRATLATFPEIRRFFGEMVDIAVMVSDDSSMARDEPMTDSK